MEHAKMTFGTNPDDLNTGGYDAFDASAIQNGWDVFDANGDKVGDVHAVNGNYLTVSKGFLFPSERYIPVRDVQGTRHDRVYLSVTKDQLEQEGWDQPPTETTGTTRDTGVYRELDRDFNRDTTGTYGDSGTRVDTAETAGRFARTGDMTSGRYATNDTTGDRTVELREQQLTPETQRVKAGEVHLHKDVVTEEQSVEVPVTHQEVVIERRPVEGERAAAGTIGQEQDVTVPVYEEQVRLDKETRPYEEVDVNTRQVQDTKRVSGQVKKEVLKVEGEGDVDVNRADTTRPTRARRTTGTEPVDAYDERDTPPTTD